MAMKVLVPVDGTEHAANVAHQMHEQYGDDADIILGHVTRAADQVPVFPMRISSVIGQADAAARQGVKLRIARIEGESVVDAIVELARQEQVDVIAMFTDPTRPESERPAGPFAARVAELSGIEVRVFEPADLT